MKQTAEGVEAEAALVRAQLVQVGTDIRHQIDPAVIVDTAKTSFKRRVGDPPALVKKNATPIGLITLGGACGAVLTGLFSKSRRSPAAQIPSTTAASVDRQTVRPSMGSQANAALLSGAGIGLGYLAGMFVPTSNVEERFLGQPKAILAQRLDDFLKEHTHGMKQATANLFGISRLSATTLIGVAMLAEVLGKVPSPAKRASREDD